MSGIRVEVERSGGFGGLSLPPLTLATGDLEPEAARELAEFVDAAERPPPRRRLPDREACPTPSVTT